MKIHKKQIALMSLIWSKSLYYSTSGGDSPIKIFIVLVSIFIRVNLVFILIKDHTSLKIYFYDIN